MIKVTYTNGDTQVINVTAAFFPITVASKNGKTKNEAQVPLPMERAETMADDLMVMRSFLSPGISLHKIEIFYPENPVPRVKTFDPMNEPEVEEVLEEGPSFTKTLKAWKKEARILWRTKKYTKWKMTF